MKKLKLEINVSHFVVTLYDKNLELITREFLAPFWSYKFEYNKRIRRNIRVKDKPFFVNYLDEDNHEVYRIHKSLLKKYLGYIGANGKISSDVVELVNNTKTKHGDYANIEFDHKKFTLRDYQERISKLALENSEHFSMINLVMGAGKSLLASYIFSELKTKMSIVVLSKYLEKWEDDILKYYPNMKDRYVIIQGGDALRDLMINAEEYKKKYDIFIFSIRTLMNYINVYDNRKGDMFLLKEYPVAPENLMQHLGIGGFLNDESHQEPGSVSKILLYFQCDFYLLLTATFSSNDPHTVKMYQMMVPERLRFDMNTGSGAHINVNNVRYYIEKAPKLKHQTNQGYSQVLFEQSILSRPYLLTQFDKMVIKYVERDYISKRKPGYKCLVYAATVDMCKHLMVALRKEYPNLNINTYVQEDDYQNLMTSDITISTPGSSGVGVDIPLLSTIIQTISMGSLQANRQMMGRLRKIEGIDTTYTALYCGNLRKHKDLYKQREACTKDIAKEWRYETYRPNAWESELKLR